MVYQGEDDETALPPAVAGPAFLGDGTEVWVRPIQPSDRDLVLDLLERESPEPLDPRHFSVLRRALAQGGAAALPSLGTHLCLLVLAERLGRVEVLGVGEYARLRSSSAVAEVAFVVAGPHRGQGIASLLLARLARAAQAFGILRFEARVRAESPEMLEVFRGSGLPFTQAPEEDEVDVLIPLSQEPGPRAPTVVAPSRSRPHRGAPSVRHGGPRAPTARHRAPVARGRP